MRVKYKGEATQRKFTKDTPEESYKFARRFLDGVRFKIEEGIFDHRDYQSSNPLGFFNLAQQYLSLKKQSLKEHSFIPIKRYLHYAAKVWGNRNIKELDFGAVEDLLTITLGHLSSKSRSNAKSAIHDFFVWVRRRKVIRHDQFPEFPEIN
ncbi:MAG: hypothetical protein LLG06_05020, partial [Desulfobacteraceae bacterium]|nr:hypothetical protein [Desulfobacteraceae bacterium]